MADDDRPRVGLDNPLRSGLGPVAEPYPPAVRAALHQGGRGRGIGPGGGAIRGGCRGPANRLGLGGYRFGEGPHDLAQRAADQAGGIARVVMAVEHGHYQAESLGGGEHQGCKPQAAADSVAALAPAGRFDRDAGLAEDAGVPAGGPL